MLILGVIVLAIGAACALYGNHLNTNFAVQFNSIFNDGEINSGTVWLIIGAVVAVIALAIIVFAVIKKKYYKF